MEGGGVLGGRLKTVPLLGDHVQQHGPLDLADHGQILLQLADVMAVDRADVAEAQFLEEHAAHQAGLDRPLDLVEEPLHRIADHRQVAQQLLHLGLQAGVEGVHPQAVERFGQAAHAGANRHLVVVEDHDEVLLQPAGMVHRLQDDAGAEGAVADDGHDAARARRARPARRRTSFPAPWPRCSRHVRS